MDKFSSIKEFVTGELHSSLFAALLYLAGALVGAAGFAIWAVLAGHNGPFVALAGLAAFVIVPFALARLQQALVSAAQRTAARVLTIALILAASIALIDWLVDVVRENRELRANATGSAPAASVIAENPDHATLSSDNKGLRDENMLLKGRIERLESELKEARSKRDPVVVQVQPSQAVQPDGEKHRRRNVRLQLARLQTDGQNLLQECHSAPDGKALEGKVLKWAQTLANYVLDNVGELEARQIESSVQSGDSQAYQMPQTVPPANRRAFDNVRYRLVRLDALIAQLGRR